jgi:hypothetical protein
MSKSTISTILKNKEEIKSAQVVKGISGLSSSCCNIRADGNSCGFTVGGGGQVIVSVK